MLNLKSKKSNNIIDIDNKLYLLYPWEDIDNYPGGGLGGGATTGGGGTGGGIVSGVVTPGIVLTPSGDQTLAIGTTRCFTASGNNAFPTEPSQPAVIDIGCSQSSNGTWIKNCGTNGNYDSECLNSKIIFKQQPFGIEGKNSVFVGGTPGSPTNNYDASLGVRTTGGYYFYWTVYKYCNATAGDCASSWLAHCRVNYPNGTMVNLTSGFVEFNQTFRLKSNGTNIIWEYTTYGNWAYNHFYMPIPEDMGNVQFLVNAGWLGNRWTNLTTYRGSYQGPIDPASFVWSTNCPNTLDIDQNTACYSPSIPGSCNICVSAEGLDPVCVDVVASPLYMNPIGIDCKDCGVASDCLNIPDPTTPVITASVSGSTIIITWSDSISFTTGLYYEVDINGVITDVLDGSAKFDSQPDGTYNIMVRAVDDCGQSEWSNVEIVEITTGALPPAGAGDFLLTPSLTKPIEYTATWTSIPSAVDYEIWAGNPQTTFLTSTTSTTILLGTLVSGMYISVRGKDVFGVYSDFSNVEIVP